jgi:hypothetical protein
MISVLMCDPRIHKEGLSSGDINRLIMMINVIFRIGIYGIPESKYPCDAATYAEWMPFQIILFLP